MAVGESSLADLKTRPDYAVTRRNALIGFIEVKAPGKGADPRRFQDKHDKEQWAKLQTLPNLIYTDGNAFSLWRNGELEGKVVHLEGDVATAGNKLAAPDGLASLFADFFQWEPQHHARQHNSPMSRPASAGCFAKRWWSSWSKGRLRSRTSRRTGGNFCSRARRMKRLRMATRRRSRSVC